LPQDLVFRLKEEFVMRLDEECSTVTDGILDILSNDDRFTKLVIALEAADLLGLLRSKGPLTVLAPTDDAFADLPGGGFDALLNNMPSLKGVLFYHLIPGTVTTEQMVRFKFTETVLGEPIGAKVGTTGTMLDIAGVIDANTRASNGLVHVIDRVLLPPGVQL
jgi:uncharacterized surface protein with fasciclin (FAS1) repeats